MFSTICVWRNDVIEKNRAGRLSELICRRESLLQRQALPGRGSNYQMRFWDWMIIYIINVAEERYQEAVWISLAAVERM
jgi:hypothetical protein